MYLSPGWQGFLKMVALLRSLDKDTVLSLNSFFSRRFSMLAIFLRRMGLIHPECLVIAPRGEFSPGALSLKRRRKMLYIRVSQWLGTYRDVIWHASSQMDVAYILKWFSGAGKIHVAAEISRSPESDQSSVNPAFQTSHDLAQQAETKSTTGTTKASGHLRVVFLSRISRMKNLLGALSMLHDLSGEVSFDIYGPLEDGEYWNACKEVIGSLPHNVRTHYGGEVEHDRVFDLLRGYDLFLLPTLGENFGHVICEALSAGCPVLISDRTPWRELQHAGVGWDIPIDQADRFSAVLQQCIDADEQWYTQLRAKAKEYARRRVTDPGMIDAYRILFGGAMAKLGGEVSVGR
jgi:glycosyltransferase involved in cell wall biosynthesis